MLHIAPFNSIKYKKKSKDMEVNLPYHLTRHWSIMPSENSGGNPSDEF